MNEFSDTAAFRTEAVGFSARRRLLCLPIVLAAILALGATACSSDNEETTPTDTPPSSSEAPASTSSTAPESSTSTSEAPPTTESTTTTTMAAITFDSLVDPERGTVDRVCFDALVEEGEILGIDRGDGYLTDGLGNQILAGHITVPGFATALDESGLDDPRLFLDLIAPVCEEIGWTQ